jgi:hypothetical protein
MTLKLLQGDWEAAGQFVGAAAATAAAPAYSFHNRRNSGMYLTPGNDVGITSDTGIVAFVGNTGGAAPNIIELYLTPVPLSGGDATIQLNGGSAGGPYNYRIVNVGSGVGAGGWVVRSVDQVDRIAISGPIATGDYPDGAGIVYFKNTSSTNPVVFRRATGSTSQETWLWHDAQNLVVKPKSASGHLDFIATLFTDMGFRAYTSDGAPFAGTGLITLKPADGTGYGMLESNNTTGFRLKVMNATGAVSYGNLTVDANFWLFSNDVKCAAKFAMNGKAPIANVAAPSAATAAYTATEQALLNDIRTRLINLGVYT